MVIFTSSTNSLLCTQAMPLTIEPFVDRAKIFGVVVERTDVLAAHNTMTL